MNAKLRKLSVVEEQDDAAFRARLAPLASEVLPRAPAAKKRPPPRRGVRVLAVIAAVVVVVSAGFGSAWLVSQWRWPGRFDLARLMSQTDPVAADPVSAGASSTQIGPPEAPGQKPPGAGAPMAVSARADLAAAVPAGAIATGGIPTEAIKSGLLPHGVTPSEAMPSGVNSSGVNSRGAISGGAIPGAASPLPEEPAVSVSTGAVPQIAVPPKAAADATGGAVVSTLADPRESGVAARNEFVPLQQRMSASNEMPASNEMIALLLRRGDAAAADGDIIAARLLYERAAVLGSATAATAAGKTYDIDFLLQSGARGIRPDQSAAAVWFRKAAALGDPEARSRLARIEGRPAP
jgi:hypothetical protein